MIPNESTPTPTPATLAHVNAGEFSATYSPEDNKLRLRAVSRLSPELYARVRAHGFIWAPRQELFVAPMWTPARVDFLLELLDGADIEDEDTTLVERAEERADRFDGYRDNRLNDANQARRAVASIADGIPFGQPILVGHHSERHARRDQRRIQNGMARAVRMWETSKYWEDRAAGALRHAKYKERPAVRARRIKTLEADLRKQQRYIVQSKNLIELWADVLNRPGKDGGAPSPAIMRARALMVANQDQGYYRREHARANGYVGPLSLWEAAGGNICGRDPELEAIATVDEVAAQATANHEAVIAHAERWVAHFTHRIAYERAMLAESGGTAADKVGPAKGGACRCWTSPRGGWSYIVKVNKVSVTVLDTWGNGGRHFTRVIAFDKLAQLMRAADVAAARTEGRLQECQPDPEGAITGFYLLSATPAPSTPSEPTSAPDPAEPDQADTLPTFDALAESLRAGVQVAAVPQLFPTPPDVARRLVDLIGPTIAGRRVLEPSAGTGNLITAAWNSAAGADNVIVRAVELNAGLCERIHTLGRKMLYTQPSNFMIHQGDFLALTPADIDGGALFDVVLMNPPFDHGADIRHIRHASTFLKPGGYVLAICANGPRQQDAFRAAADVWEPLTAGTFAGTNVSAALVKLTKAAAGG